MYCICTFLPHLVMKGAAVGGRAAVVRTDPTVGCAGVVADGREALK